MNVSIVLKSRVQLTGRVGVELLTLARGVAKLAFIGAELLGASNEGLCHVRCSGRCYWWFPEGGPRLLVAQLGLGQEFEIGGAFRGVIESLNQRSVGLRVLESHSTRSISQSPHPHGKSMGAFNQLYLCKESHVRASTGELCEHQGTTCALIRGVNSAEREPACLSKSGISRIMNCSPN